MYGTAKVIIIYVLGKIVESNGISKLCMELSKI